MDLNDLPPFMKKAFGIEETEEPREWLNVRHLDEEELEEWNSLRAEADRLITARERLEIEKNIYSARAKKFWFDIEHSRRHPNITECSLRIEDGIIQKAVQETE